MSQLRSVLDEMSAFDDENLTSEEIAADITELAYARQVIDVLMATRQRHLPTAAAMRSWGTRLRRRS